MKINSVNLKYVVAVQENNVISEYKSVEEPQIVFVGRSNVGKSSLINSLSGRVKIARISNTPGKTRQINYYLVNNSFYFVDLPGYGFAKESQAARNNWKNLIEDYFTYTKKILLCFLILDIRNELSLLDRNMADWLDHLNLKHIVVLNKADKLSNNELSQKIPKFQTHFADSRFCTGIFPYSSLTGKGKIELQKIMDVMLSQ
jgi:GTP-binding protein